jgi:hypothetical protein
VRWQAPVVDRRALAVGAVLEEAAERTSGDARLIAAARWMKYMGTSSAQRM